MQQINNIQIEMSNTPDVAGLSFCRFRGKEDYPAMVAVIKECREADKLEWAISVEDTERDYEHLQNCDPYQDLIFAEIDGVVVGYGRCWWYEEYNGDRVYFHFAHLIPKWRGRGIRQAMVTANETRLREIATTHPEGGERHFRCWASETETHWESVLQKTGYEPIRYAFDMIRSNLDNIPNLPLPDGVELRPANREQWPIIFAAAADAFKDHWGAGEWSEEDRKGWEKNPSFNPALWQVAWDGDEVAAGVLTFINKKENEEYGRLRGYTETIFTRRQWRRRGLAHALIARSLAVQKEQGMNESALGVDAENLTGALNIYKNMGFEVDKRSATYQKPLNEQG